MKKQILKLALAATFIFASASMVKAQTFGDNLGNHKATKDLDMNTHQVLNTTGILIGGATPLVNTSVALQVGNGTQAIVLSSVTDTTAIATPVNGMIVYGTTSKKLFVYQDSKCEAFASSAFTSTSSSSRTAVAIPAGSSAGFASGGNSAIQFTLTVAGTSIDDGVAVNFANADILSFAGLTILSAVATAANTVTVTVADLRNPGAPGYAVPAIDGKNLVVTRFTL